MSTTGGAPLWLLWRLKARGAVRRQWRRLRTWKGALLTTVGSALFGLWLLSLTLGAGLGRGRGGDPELLRRNAALVALGLALVTLSSAFVHRGLFIPSDEIERLLSAPVSRRALVRYRLRANALRNVLGGAFVGVMAARHMPRPVLAFVAVLVGMQTLAVLHQLLALLIGSLETRFARRLQRAGRLALLALVVVAPLLAVGTGLVGGGSARLAGLRRWLADRLPLGEADALAHPVLDALLAPFTPWVRAVAAPDLAAGAPWLVACLAIWLLLHELTARVPMDFRELSLATSASVAARIRRARIGGGAAAGRVSRRTLGWRVPWWWGRGPEGAVVWRKTGSIVRKARGTLLVSVLVLAFVTLLSIALQSSGSPTWAGPLLIAGFGTIYLCAGLRFDFRDELERMEVIRSWPIGARRLFVCMLLPQSLLVTLLLAACILLRCWWGGGPDGITLGILVLTPPVAFAWLALDNAVFLFAPVRFVPGQEGALQNAGRGMLMLLVRLLLLTAIALAGALGYGVSLALADAFELPHRLALATTFLSLFAVLCAADLALVALGGWVLARFDVARDPG